MDNPFIFKNKFVGIFSLFNDVLIETYKLGFHLEQLQDVLLMHPEIEVENFNIVKNALDEAPKPKQRFGALKRKNKH